MKYCVEGGFFDAIYIAFQMSFGKVTPWKVLKD